MISNIFVARPTDVELALQISKLQWLTEAELEYQRQVLKARRYHRGDQLVFLTDRLKEFLAIDELDDDPDFNVNVFRVPAMAIVERLKVIGFDSPSAEFAQWSWELWQAAKLDVLQEEVHENAVAEGEYFLFIEPDAARGALSFITHFRFTDSAVGGMNEGCVVFYPNGNVNQKPTHALKRWEETDDKGHTVARQNVYFPDHFERWVKRGAQWEPLYENGAYIYPWVTRDGKPIGIPIVHFANRGLAPEAWSARGLQDLLNKTYLDLAANADVNGFGYHFLFGASAKDKDGNPIQVQPGSIIAYPDKKPADAAVTTVHGEDLTPLRELKNDIIFDVARITDTPVARFQASGQLAASETLKEQDAPFAAKVQSRQALFGTPWEEALRVARNIWETFIDPRVPADAPLQSKWKDAFPRNALERAQEIEIKVNSGKISLQQAWREWNYSEAQIAQMLKDREDELLLMQRVALADTVVGNQ